MITEHVLNQAGAGRLAGKVALVTGASRGIGAEIARRFAREGAAVALAARDAAALAQVAAEITAAGGHALAVPLEITDDAAVARLIQQTVQMYGRLDLAVNNAGMSIGNKPLVEISAAEFDRALAVNLKGVFLALKYEIPALLAGGGGAIVNMSSTVGLIGYGGIAAYVAAKHGVVGLTKAAAFEYAGQNIRVNAIAPGTTRTPVNERWMTDPQILARMISAIPLGRVGEPADIAEAALWLCSDASAYVTGVTLPVDGGFIIS
jgi:NAD(P)-dependent dehydrogenase (short-subunit alcohol dehydrogenase family)